MGNPDSYEYPIFVWQSLAKLMRSNNMHKTLSVILSVLLLSLFAIPLYANSDEFPGRAKYPDLPYMELGDLYGKRNDVLIVDARSMLEFDTLKIKGAVNIPVASKSFENQVLDLRKSTTKPIVFYCNGRKCMKSFIAVKKAKAVGVNNVYAYDAGIFEWTVAYPDEAVLLEQTPVNISALISKKDFSKRLLTPDVFSTKAIDMGKQSMVLDVRDKFQRAGIGFYPGKERWVSLDNMKKLEKYLLKAKKSNKTLFIYDEVGKQVRWLQYALEKHGIKDYYFMDKGARAYYASLSSW
jgi:rhodanese-related sulfurtransferase